MNRNLTTRTVIHWRLVSIVLLIEAWDITIRSFKRRRFSIFRDVMSRLTVANHNAQEIGENNKHREGSTCRLVATSMVKEPSSRRGFGHHRHIWRLIDQCLGPRNQTRSQS